MSIVLHMLVDIIMLVHISIVCWCINMLCKSPSIYVSKYHITHLQCILFYDHTDNLLANIV